MYINVPFQWQLTNGIMADHGIRAHMSGGCIRISIHYFNNKADLDRPVDFLKNYGK